MSPEEFSALAARILRPQPFLLASLFTTSQCARVSFTNLSPSVGILVNAVRVAWVTAEVLKGPLSGPAIAAVQTTAATRSRPVEELRLMPRALILLLIEADVNVDHSKWRKTLSSSNRCRDGSWTTHFRGFSFSSSGRCRHWKESYRINGTLVCD